MVRRATDVQKKGASNHGIQPRKHELNEDAGKSLPCIDDRHVEMVEKDEFCTESHLGEAMIAISRKVPPMPHRDAAARPLLI